MKIRQPDEIRVCDAEQYGVDLESAEYTYGVTPVDTAEVPTPAAETGDKGEEVRHG